MKVRRDFLPFGRPHFSAAEIRAVAALMKKGWIGMGPEVIEFERELSRAVKAPHVVTVNSCTSALWLALRLHGIGPGDEVIVPSMTWCSTANAALYVGAKPVFCDVDGATMCATPEMVAARLSPRTKAVIIVHFGGRAIDVGALRAALPRRVALIEDAAHAFGAEFSDGRPVGSSGNITCFSFYANKNLSTCEGGALALFDERMAKRALSMRQHGLPADAWKRYSQPRTAFLSNSVLELGFKMNYTDLQAVIGRVQLKRQPEFARRRLAIATIYAGMLAKARPAPELVEGQLDRRHARHLFIVKLPLDRLRLGREEIFMSLRRRNVGVSIHYGPLHLMPFYREMDAVKLPNTEELYERIITLPISASMTPADARYVGAHLIELLEEAAR